MYPFFRSLTLLFLFASCCIGAAEDARFVIFSPPKCGTFLSAKTLSLMTEKTPAYYLNNWELSNLEVVDLVENETANGKFVVTHHFNGPTLKLLAKMGYKIIFIVRDLRDQLISVTNWLREGQWRWMPAAKMLNIDAQIEELIFGKLYGQRCVDIYFLSYEERLEHVPSRSLCTIRFENLVGEHGGGTLEAQQKEIQNLAKFLNMRLGKEKVDEIAAEIFGGTATFRSGQIGSWRDYFSNNHKKLFKLLYNHQLIRLGYEEDASW